jgi:hypothetical protein
MEPPPPPLPAPLPIPLVELPPEVVEPPPVVTAAGAITVVWAEADLVESAAETAVTVTTAGAGTVIGAVYTPDVEIMPSVALPPATPLTLQFTDVFDEPVTAAVNVWVMPVCTLADVGVIDMATGVVIVTCADEDFVASAADVAVTVTVAGVGTDAGAM